MYTTALGQVSSAYSSDKSLQSEQSSNPASNQTIPPSSDFFFGAVKPPKPGFLERLFKKINPAGTSSWSLPAVFSAIGAAAVLLTVIGGRAHSKNLSFGKASGELFGKLKFWGEKKTAPSTKPNAPASTPILSQKPRQEPTKSTEPEKQAEIKEPQDPLSSDKFKGTEVSGSHSESSKISSASSIRGDSVLQALKTPKDLEKALEGMTADEKVALLNRKFTSGNLFESNKFDEQSQTTFFHSMACKRNNEETLDVLLRGLSSDQKMGLLRLKSSNNMTPLLDVVTSGRTENIPVILEGLSSKQRLECLKVKDPWSDNTPIHAIKPENENADRSANALLEGLNTRDYQEVLKLKNQSTSVRGHLNKIKKTEEIRRATVEKQLPELVKTDGNKFVHSINQFDGLAKLRIVKDNPEIVHHAVDSPDKLEALLKDLTFEQTKEILQLRSAKADEIFSQGKGYTALTRMGSRRMESRTLPLLFKGLTAEQKIDLATLVDANGNSVIHTASLYGHPSMDVLFAGLSSLQKRDLLLLKNNTGEMPIHLNGIGTESTRAMVSNLEPEHKMAVLEAQSNKGVLAIERLNAFRFNSEDQENAFDYSLEAESPLDIGLQNLDWPQKKKLLLTTNNKGQTWLQNIQASKARVIEKVKERNPERNDYSPEFFERTKASLEKNLSLQEKNELNKLLNN